MPELPPMVPSARARWRRWRRSVRGKDYEFGLALLQEALDDAGDHPRVRSQIECWLSGWLANRGSYAAGLPHTKAAVEYAERAGDRVWLAIMRTEQAGLEGMMNGRGVSRRVLEEYAAIEDLMESTGVSDSPSFALGRGLFHYATTGTSSQTVARAGSARRE